MAYSWGMSERWLEIEDGTQTHRVPLVGTVTRIGGAAADVSMSLLPPGELHVWSDPPKVVLVAGSEQLTLNGVMSREGLLTDGDLIEWGAVRMRFRQEAGAPVLEEIHEQEVVRVAPAVSVPAASVELPAAAPQVASASGDGGGAAWARVRAGMLVDLGLGNKAAVKNWQATVMRGDFAPDACARDVAAGVVVGGDDPRLVERSARLLRDFVMASAMSGAEGAKRRARQAGKKGAAIFISQLFLVSVITLIILAVMLLLHAKWPDVYFDPLFDKLLPDK
jgi:hypothetical protein